MSFAVELYTSPRMGMSLRGITKILKKAFNIKVSYESVRQWILTTKKKFYRRETRPTTWHADETYIKIKGKGYWLWVVFCEDTKQVLSWYISKDRFYKDARYVLQKALENAKVKPELVITDGLYAYRAAVKKLLACHWRIYRKKHLVDSGIGKNAIIERLNREIKRRVKWFSTFQSMKGALAFFGLWFYHYNQSKSQYLT